MNERTITADATAERRALPELAQVTLEVTGDGTTAAEARRAVRDRASAVRTALEDAVSADRVRTTSVEVDPSSDLFEAETDLPYEASERLEVDCTPDTVEEVVVCATDAGATVPVGSHSLTEGRERDLQDEALTAATERAREKAACIAAAEGLSVGRVRRVETREVSTGMDSIVEDALANNRQSSIQPTPVTVSAAVEAVYELEE